MVNHRLQPRKKTHLGPVHLLMLGPQTASQHHLVPRQTVVIHIERLPVLGGVIGMVILRFAAQIARQMFSGQMGGDLSQDLLGDIDILRHRIDQSTVIIP